MDGIKEMTIDQLYDLKDELWCYRGEYDDIFAEYWYWYNLIEDSFHDVSYYLQILQNDLDYKIETRSDIKVKDLSKAYRELLEEYRP